MIQTFPSVLVVEDDPSAGRALCCILKLEGWVPKLVSSVAEAIKALNAFVKFVVLDLMLPDGDGELVLQFIRNKGLKTPVCVTTGCGDLIRLEKLKLLFPDYLMQKPIDITQLCLMIREASGI